MMNMVQVSCEDLPFLVGQVVLRWEGSRQTTGDGEKFTRIQQTADQYKLDEKKNGELLVGDNFGIELGNCKIKRKM